MLEIILTNLVSPAVLFFALGLIASWVKSDLKFPSALSESLSIYLLIAIGIKGGIELSEHSVHELIKPVAGTLLLGILIPIITFVICRRMRFDRKNAIGIAATYGSVSIVTFGAALAFLNMQNVPYESYMNALVVLLESPAIILSIFMLHFLKRVKPENQMEVLRNQAISKSPFYSGILKESLFGKSVLLMAGSFIIGLIAGESAFPKIKPLFVDLYSSILMIFLLGMGLLAGEQLAAVKKYGFRLIFLGLFFPLLYGVVGIFIGAWCGLSVGGTMLMGVLAASASYIAAPAAMRASVPEANPSIYLGMSLGITFPFNLTIGISVYYHIAQWIQ
ncbi:sodium-dependent bicarbonate transport family permease [Paranoxybacillus vitaminiphilus]|uniref:sodium-dependent bicarbonate transport family permease n=1 Tax=Paranoxybacillus vitaminiphilus TaxID=581036 RepID=UPI000DB98C6F|nr:sodium-dependent bicarbonate transport family permease [Anoxybacillus vitaminiphilus]